MTAPTPQRAASAEERDRLRLSMAQSLDREAFKHGQPDYYGADQFLLAYSDAQRLALKTADILIAGPLAPLLDRITAAEAELAKVATVVRAAAVGEWTDSFEAMVEEACAWEVRAKAAEARAEEAERERDGARAQKGIVGPCLWGRYPRTGIWHQIDDGSHTEEEVAAFETDYAAAGWTELRRTNPFRDAATADRDRLADEVVRLRSALKPFTAETATGIYCFPGPDGRGFTVEMGWAFDAARALTATGGTTDGQA